MSRNEVLKYLKDTGPATVWEICKHFLGVDYAFKQSSDLRHNILFYLVRDELLKINYDNTYEYVEPNSEV